MATQHDGSPPVHVLFGASGGIGTATARRLAASGARVVLVGRDPTRLEALSSELDAPVVAADCTEPEQAEAAVQQAVERFGRVDGIANLIGSLLLKPAHRTSIEEFDETVRINLRSAFAAVRAAANVMRRNGSVVLMSTAAARLGLANHEAIAAAKGGVTALGQAAAASYASRQIRVNVVAPGLIQTPLTTQVTENEANRKASEAMHPLGSLGDPDSVASAIAWFLDPAQHWVTGQILGVDGGLGTVRSRA